MTLCIITSTAQIKTLVHCMTECAKNQKGKKSANKMAKKKTKKGKKQNVDNQKPPC